MRDSRGRGAVGLDWGLVLLLRGGGGGGWGGLVVVVRVWDWEPGGWPLGWGAAVVDMLRGMGNLCVGFGLSYGGVDILGVDGK